MRRTWRRARPVFYVGLLSCAFALNTFSQTPPTSHVDLGAAYQAALTKTEGVEMQAAVARQAEERLSQATGKIFPNVSLLASYLVQDSPVGSGSGSTSAFTRQDQSSARVNLTQPLFRGLGEWAERRSREALWKGAQALEKQAKVSLYSAVAQSYYQTLTAGKDVDNLRAMKELTQKRTEELKGRVRIGRSRKGELLAAEAQVATLEAQIESAEAVLDQTRETFALTTGLPRDTQLLDPKEDLPGTVPPLETLLLLIEARPDLQAKKQELEAADESTVVARAGHLPSLDFTANYYLRRTGVLADAKWDLGVNLTIPLFQGGVIQSGLRESYEKKKEKELSLSLSRRQAVKEIKALYRELSGQMAQHRALKNALTIAENNYTVQNRDYRFGLSTHLDVLQALNSFQETKRLLDRTRFQALAAFASLKAATGTVP